MNFRIVLLTVRSFTSIGRQLFEQNKLMGTLDEAFMGGL